jgi:hypothetical protein
MHSHVLKKIDYDLTHFIPCPNGSWYVLDVKKDLSFFWCLSTYVCPNSFRTLVFLVDSLDSIENLLRLWLPQWFELLV